MCGCLYGIKLAAVILKDTFETPINSGWDSYLQQPSDLHKLWPSCTSCSQAPYLFGAGALPYPQTLHMHACVLRH